MTDRPIIFSAQMVRALLVGRKTQTRRVLRPQLGNIAQAFEFTTGSWRFVGHDGVRVYQSFRPPFSNGDRLWVREAHALVPSSAYRMSDGVAQVIDPSDRDYACVYREGWERSAPRWRPSIHMPRWASRLTLIVTDVRVQRLQQISEEDAVAEGVMSDTDGWTDYLMPSTQCCQSARASFCSLWNSIHGPEAWDANPWLAAITFRTIRANIDSAEAAA